ncbi:hypothetical protein GTW43_32685 [Streptomyces sp. SID5785]|uniref:hypothetical protein n=1 Tax=Streptomyces sp. SID5785 TaxID=2690309 RepID=UPI0013610316|nr:hypothetical protein [Streptomyces sp. SID5785]MZD09804.1 hypothetical protein [Streptomyces sp. SID5785]
MRSISVLSSVALASLVAVGPAAGAAFAGDDGGTRPDVTSFGFTVTPSTVAAGGTVTLSATGCEEPSVTVDSPVFDRTTLNEGHSATAQVYPDAKPGAQYDVTFTCKGEKGTTPLTIAGGSGHTSAPVDRGVRAGVGGSVGGTDPTLLVGGGVLIAGALGAGYVRLRKRRADAA